jgi:enamine deaminase RidA (YjgF/YER057c/UK114 family)
VVLLRVAALLLQYNDTYEKGKTVSTHPTNIRFINPPTLSTPPGYTHVVEITHGRTVFISGQIALDQAGNVVGPNDFHAQAQQVFENLKVALGAVGADFTHVVKLHMYVVDMTQLPILRTVRDRYVNTQHPPASTLVEVRKLAREEFLLEIEAVAYLPE